MPDAILPPGVRPPPSGSGPFTTTPEAGPELEAGAVGPPTMAAVLTPVYHSEGEIPLDEPSAPGPAQPSAPAQAAGKEGAGKRRLLLVGGGAAAVLAAVAALFAIGGTGSGDDGAARKPAESPAASPAAPGTASPVPAPGAVNIDDEKTDPNDLAFADVFPTATLRLGGRTFTRDRWSINRDLAYAANGAMLRALTRENCRKVVRATYLDRSRSIAVTSGIAVMPTSAAALKVSRVGDPARYEWFRGMAGKHAPDIDRAGGYAAVTVRGRYVVYAYVQRIDGKQVKPGDPAIKQAAQQFLDHDVRPIEARARR
ncbi:hypothetical protein [Actinomadura fibrosa]|uniref:Serine/threonine protein kinase n=1 Tax=Actinomadura fibrosa TaxID=111802 RepID=A0ABW2XIC3_9ACTN|nr:hypothetical protein [Actinomadura fibrosa]